MDKITILTLKEEYISVPSKGANVRQELAALREAMPSHVSLTEGLRVTSELLEINRSLWDIEDEIRDCERKSEFGPRFIELARSVYITNDKRADLKRQINTPTGSALVEEKSCQAH